MFNFLSRYDNSKGGQLETEIHSKYECLNERRSWGGAMRGGALERAIRRVDENIIEKFSEMIDYELPQEEKGGIIVFSTDVNVLHLSQTNLGDKLKQFFLIWKQRYQEINKNKIFPAWTTGRFFKGNYTDMEGNLYSENSLSVEIIGVTFNELIKIAEDFCADFVQQTVLVKTYTENSILLVNPN